MLPVHAPSIRSLQLYNLLCGLGIMLSAMTATAQWNAAGWSERRIGMAMTGVTIGYAVLVLLGGRLSDTWGRGRTAAMGGCIMTVGCALAATMPGPWMALAAAVLAFSGSAFFFPGNAGLFSDAVTPGEQRQLPLHQKVSGYNLGWASGNLGGFIGYSLLAERPPALGFAICTGLFLVLTVSMLRWLHVPPRPPQAEGDRASHPALARLTLMARCAALVVCTVTMAQIALLQVALRGMEVPSETAQRWAGVTLVTYASCYVTLFVLLGRWSGWVLKPWRMWWLQTPFVIGSAGFLVLGLLGTVSPWSLALCGGCLGLAFGPCYTASIYYSMRLPDGAGRATALHEMCIGIGNVGGPLLGGLFIDRWLALGFGNGLAGLGCFALIGAVIALGLQAAMIPAASRLGAR